jgi:hypothetical protein
MDPEPVSHLKIGNFGDRQGMAFALDANINFWPGQIEGSRIGGDVFWAESEEGKTAKNEQQFPETVARINQNALLPFGT